MGCACAKKNIIKLTKYAFLHLNHLLFVRLYAANAMDFKATSASTDSGLDTSNDSNDTITLRFPPGFNQAAIIQYTTRHDLLMFGGGGDKEPKPGGSGANKECDVAAVQPQPTTSSPKTLQSTVSAYCLAQPQQPQLMLSRSFYKMKHRPMAGSHKSALHVSPYMRTKSNERKLRLAASLANIEVLLRLLEAGVNPNGADDYQRTALHLAASRGYIDIVVQLLKFGAKANQKDSLGNTPLHLAVCSASSFNFNMVVRILLKYGASVHATDNLGKNPLDLVKSKLSMMRSRSNGAPESAKILLDLSVLTSVLLHTYVQQEQSFDIGSLAERLEQLSTNEIENEADMLLAKVEQLTLKSE